MTDYEKALKDWASVSTHIRLWCYLAWIDIKQRYVGSIIGPFWITLTMIIFIGCLCLVYSQLFHQPYREYIPFLTAGLTIWIYISSTIADSCEMFTNSKQFVYSTQLPYSLFLYRIICRNLIILLHNAVVFILVMIVFQIKPNLNFFYVIPGLMLVTVNLIGISMVVGLLSTRYRDIPPIINSLIQVAFFVSPITWAPKMLGASSLILSLNPISHFMLVTRDPLLGNPIEWASVEYLLIFAFCSVTLSFLIFANVRNRIPFWL